ncbi:hypothetical protein Xbed_02616 [Xenorhabdus beddingii]|uniref:ABC-three component systems C-terminal domain-containing protein n=1 Tax=Xenorhabdus beddingii TaxID=40578 RepID=A0A1Y2SK50_9GAMM|nr:ABC-three component system protein [Xenorhabdus beddingii]OTA19219.1 hypothetical protein Xbed_02616 [Xenorhabdus beddingii]
MNSSQRTYLYVKLFRLKIHEASGEAFQELFSKIMSYSEDDFQSVSPWGSWGDGGNDGWIPLEKHYFQVYGPKPNTQIKINQIIDKAVGDFEKLSAKWGTVEKYSFVMNDRFQGIPAPISPALLQLKENKGLLYVGTVNTTALLKRFMSLTEDERQDIIGLIPSDVPDFIDRGAIMELLNHLINKSPSGLQFLSDTAPDFEEKIKFNGLHEQIGLRLRLNSFKIAVIDEYLDSIDEGYQQSIAEEIKNIYARSKERFPDNLGDAADLRYFWILDELVPEQAKENPHSATAFSTMAEIILAKYFETCDAYEHPNNAATA